MVSDATKDELSRKHGRMVAWRHPSGAVGCQTRWWHGKRHGTWRAWHANGVRSVLMRWNRDRHIVTRRFYVTGEKSFEVRGEDGVYHFFYRTGQEKHRLDRRQPEQEQRRYWARDGTELTREEALALPTRWMDDEREEGAYS